MTLIAQRIATLRTKASAATFRRTLATLRPHRNCRATASARNTTITTSVARTRSLPATASLTSVCRLRHFHSSPLANVEYKQSELSDGEYHSVADQTMDAMVEYFEDLGDEIDFPGFDIEYQSGVMTLKLGDKGTYVVNKQPPNKQLWLSSPTSGPKRYDYDAEHKVWFYTRDHHSLHWLLNTEISEALGIKIHVPVGEDE